MKKVLVSLLIGCMVLGVGCGEATVSKAEYDKVVKSNEQLVENNANLVKDKQELQAKIDSAKAYFELDENEKKIVDSKIEEVNNLTEAQIAEEEHQFELQVERNKVSVYVDLINNKSYADMSDDGKAKVDEFINEKFAEIPDELKPEYQPIYDKAVQSKSEYENKLAEEAAAAEEAKRQAEAQKYETGLTWEQIAREGKVGTLGKFEGKILQVVNNGSWVSYRVAINGDYDQVMYVEDALNKATETLLEDDYVYFKGMSMGTTSYTTVLGAKVTIPSFMVDEIHR